MTRIPILFVLSALFLLSSCTDFGDKVNDGDAEVYYKDGVKEDEAEKLLKFLVENGVMQTDKGTQSAQLTKSGKTYKVKIVAGPDLEDTDNLSEPILAQLEWLRSSISTDVLDGAKVELHLTDDKFETLRKFK